jgi:2-polyprenyl-6-methoxyphenol hydroxylase-like FAD-dependent oxidoreductase
MVETDVLVVGAGPTGLMAACELTQWGVRVRVLDAATGPFTGSRGKGIQPRTLEVLESLGVAGRLVSLGRFRIPMRAYSADGGVQDQDGHPGVVPTPDSPYARTLVIPQWRVEETLRELLAGFGVEVEYGRAVVGLEQDPHRVVAELADGSGVAADYLVGSDGGSSTVRRLLGVTFLGETNEDVRMLVADVRLEGLSRDFWHMWRDAGGRGVALCPMPATDTFQLQAPLPPGAEGKLSLDLLQSMVDDAVGAGQVRLREVTWMSRWRLNVRMVDRYRVGRVFLAGDAAHVHSPSGGQGMNTGIQDAANLSWKLAHVLAGADPALLDTYQSERLPVAAGVLGLSSRLLGVPPGAQRTADREEARQLSISYRGGPLATRAKAAADRLEAGDQEVAGDRAPEAGDRAPDAPCVGPDGRAVRLFELRRGPHWLLLGFGVRPERPAGPVRVVGIGDGLDLVDAAGHARRAYRAEDGDLVLIRPDGYLGMRGGDPVAVRAYLDDLGVGKVGVGAVGVGG